MQRDFIATADLLGSDEGPGAVLTDGDRRTAVFQRRSQSAAGRAQEIVVARLHQAGRAKRLDDDRRRADHAVAVEVLLEARLQQLQGRTGSGNDPAGAVGDHVAVDIGIPDRVLIGPRQVQRDFVAAADLLRADERPGAVLADGDRRTIILQRRPRSTGRAQHIVAAGLQQARRAERLDDDRCRADHPVAVQVLLEARLQRSEGVARPGDDPAGAVGDHVAVGVGIPDRVLIGARQMQRDFIAAADLLRADERPGAVFACGNRRTGVLQQRTRSSTDRIQKIVASHLGQRRRTDCLDDDGVGGGAGQVIQADCSIAGEVDREIGDPISIGVALQRRNSRRAIVEIIELAGRTAECGRPDEFELVVAAGGGDRVDPAQVDAIYSHGEIGDPVMLAAAGRTLPRQEQERVAVTAAGQGIDAGAADQPVTACAAEQRVVAAAARQRGPGIARNQRVVAAAADRLLDDRAERNADIVDETADRREGTRMQIDGLRRGVAGTIKRIVAAAVIDGQRRRPGIIVAEAEYRAGIAVEAVDGVSRPRRGRRAVHCSHRVDIRNLRRDDVAVGAPGIIRFREVRHDRILPGVVGEDRVGRIGRTAVVRPLMAEAERMPDLVHVGLVGIAVDAGLAVIGAAVGGNPVGADIDGRPGYCTVAIPRGTRSGLHRAVMGERDVRGAGGLDEGHIGDLGPRLQRRQRKELFRRIQPADIVGDGVGSPLMGQGIVVLPETVDQIVGERCDRRHRFRRAGRDRGYGLSCQWEGIAGIGPRVPAVVVTRLVWCRDGCSGPSVVQEIAFHRSNQWQRIVRR